MLDATTKARIDSARDILVGKGSVIGKRHCGQSGHRDREIAPTGRT